MNFEAKRIGRDGLFMYYYPLCIGSNVAYLKKIAKLARSSSIFISKYSLGYLLTSIDLALAL